MQSKLRELVIDKLRNRPYTLTYKMIADQTGLNEAWIGSLLRYPDKGSDSGKLECLYLYLYNKKLITID